jgi:UPF0755 protein
MPKKIKVTLSVILGVILIVGISAFVWTNSNKGPDEYIGEHGVEIELTVPSGYSSYDIAELLVKNQVVKSAKSFVSDVNERGLGNALKAGSYLFTTLSSNDDAIDILEGGVSTGSKVLIKEGYTIKDIIAAVSTTSSISKDEVEQALNISNYKLPVQTKYLEGWLFPATYNWSKSTSLIPFFQQMIDKTVEVLTNNNVPVTDYEDVLIKASIVEKEVGIKYYSKAARVIENRLKSGAVGYSLGMDTTVAYGLGKDAAGLNQKELDDASNKWNTRKNKGLPPSPICSPGEKAIQGVINPEPGKWIYFVTTNLDTGETKFTDNNKQFQKYVKELIAWESSK